MAVAAVMPSRDEPVPPREQARRALVQALPLLSAGLLLLAAFMIGDGASFAVPASIAGLAACSMAVRVWLARRTPVTERPSTPLSVRRLSGVHEGCDVAGCPCVTPITRPPWPI